MKNIIIWIITAYLANYLFKIDLFESFVITGLATIIKEL